MTDIQIAAVGDLMVKRYIISDAKLANGTYSFDPLLEKVAPILKKADLTIGNLETTFAGTRNKVRRKSGGPLFTCPDEAAPALKRAGFDVLITANNHCMDYGSSGLLRTLRILKQNGIEHTGTFHSLQHSKEFLIKTVKGVRIGILTYTAGLNGIPLPSNKSWMVNLIRKKQMIADIKHLKKHADLLIVYLHFGKEYSHRPNRKQRQLVNLLFRHGANIILGSHPHVLQPLIRKGKRQMVIYSLGNFISTQLKRNIHTQSSIILKIKIKKNDKGEIIIAETEYTPTLVHRIVENGRAKTEVIPIHEVMKQNHPNLKTKQRQQYQNMLNKTIKIIKNKA
ncbi:CapA family protein [Paenibacillus spongiae]|uniref:CapA family protein n=1 Tax=Paenibacillus spongiae TaxID=2909671 RepID=A0ABY5S1I3_9BACL|nr:CapA family protein [Paenibacillus spongiae]UVI27731.1 CapA family protein [Paenibacillus spongiae]